VIFDLWETLVDYDQAAGRAFQDRVAERLDRDPDEFAALWLEGRASRESGTLRRYLLGIGVADDLVDASPEELLRSEKIDPFDVAETALYLATLGKYSVVHQIVIDRLGADW